MIQIDSRASGHDCAPGLTAGNLRTIDVEKLSGCCVAASMVFQQDRSKEPVYAALGRHRNDLAFCFAGFVCTLGSFRARTNDLRCVPSAGSVQALLLGLWRYGACDRFRAEIPRTRSFAGLRNEVLRKVVSTYER